jgi:hypothetical protein
MKVQLQVPTQNDLICAYNLLQQHRSIDISQLVLFCCWSRFDPRLGQLTIEHLSTHWSKLNPLKVNLRLLKSPMPMTWGVLVDHLLLLESASNRPTIKKWRDCCLSNIKKGPSENFFIGLHAFAGKAQKEEAFNSLPLYKKWGYLSKDPMIPLTRNQLQCKKTLMSKSQRLQKLKVFLKSNKTFSIHDYISLLEGKVSLRTAEMDLKKFAHRYGNTRASLYRK